MMSSSIPVIRAKHLRCTSALLDRAGAPVDRLLEQVRLSPSLRDAEPEDLLPATAVLMFREQAARNLGLRNIALELVGEASIKQGLGEIGQIILAEPTIYRGLDAFCLHARHDCSHLWTGLRLSDDFLWVQHRNDTPLHAGMWHTELYCLLWMLKVARLADPGWQPHEVRLRAQETSDRRRCTESLGWEHVKWGCRLTEFAVPRAMLSHPVRAPADETAPDVRAFVHHFQRSEDLDSVSRGLSQLLRHPLTERWWSLEEVAEVVGIPARTLQRRLSDERTSYSRVLREARLERSLVLLSDGDLPIPEIAASAGFSTHSNFTRAFHQWVGLTPSEFRQQRRAQLH
jgi:AraC-like DNA-binding protein